jgi:hypothetical protein
MNFRIREDDVGFVTSVGIDVDGQLFPTIGQQSQDMWWMFSYTWMWGYVTYSAWNDEVYDRVFHNKSAFLTWNSNIQLFSHRAVSRM